MSISVAITDAGRMDCAHYRIPNEQLNNAMEQIRSRPTIGDLGDDKRYAFDLRKNRYYYLLEGGSQGFFALIVEVRPIAEVMTLTQSWDFLVKILKKAKEIKELWDALISFGKWND